MIQRFLLVLACLLLSLAPACLAADRPPSVVMIVADDLGYADIGVQAVADDVKTPNIDSIAAAGVRFTNGYVSAPVCSPSRAGFLTGRYQERFGHEANPMPKFDGTFGLPLDQVMLAQQLKKSSYATGMFGKWHLGGQEAYQPQSRGFDQFIGFLGGAHGYYKVGVGPNALRHNGEPLKEHEDYLTESISRNSADFIRKHKDEPFFLYVPYNAVHTPLEVPQKYLDRFPQVSDPDRKKMLAMLSAADDGVGQILGALRDSGIEDNTLVIFFSDNGAPPANASSNSPLRGNKGQLWEGGIRIPFMIKFPGRIPAGKVLDDPVITLDLFPTILAACGADAPEGVKLDGVNLLPWLAGKSEKPHETLYWRFKPQFAIRDGSMKLVRSIDGKVALYDLSKDLGETKDLASEHPEVVKTLQEKFDAWNAGNREPLWPGKQEGMVRRPARGAGPATKPAG